jgi:DNA polymerase-4
VVVGGAGNRGVVAAASYPARARGVRSAMPIGMARRLAPDLVIVPGRMQRYREVSSQVMGILRDVTDKVEQISVDEAFLDVRGARRLFGDAASIATLLRSRIREELGLPSSVGGSVSRGVAKIASARAKPDGQLLVAAEEVAAFLAPLEVGAVWGIGPQAQKALGGLGVRTIGQLRDVPTTTLRRVLGPQAPQIARLAAGEDRTGIGTRVRDRSVGTERTFDVDLADRERIRARLIGMADEVGRSLRRDGFLARTVSLKVRRGDSSTFTRSATMGQPTASGERLREHVLVLWERESDRVGSVRLLGVRAENLVRTQDAGTAGEVGPGSGWQDLEAAMDRARDRFGSASLGRGSMIARSPSGEDSADSQSP